MDVWVLGCGPSLKEVNIPPDVFTIGTNSSYKVHWSPVWAGTDLRALRRDYAVEDHERPLVWFAGIDPARVGVRLRPGRPLVSILRPERPSLRKAGVFAYWLACEVFKASRVHLVGFDMETRPSHFDDARFSDTYVSQRFQLKEIQEKSGVESWIFLIDRFVPVSSLPAKGMRVGRLYYSGKEKDITEGMMLPQDLWRKNVQK